MKHHPPHHHREIHANYLYMANSLIKMDHKVMQEWANAVLTQNHTVVITPNNIVVQGCANVVCTYVRTDTKTYNCNIHRMTGAAHESLSYHPREICSEAWTLSEQTKDRNGTWNAVTPSVG